MTIIAVAPDHRTATARIDARLEADLYDAEVGEVVTVLYSSDNLSDEPFGV